MQAGIFFKSSHKHSETYSIISPCLSQKLTYSKQGSFIFSGQRDAKKIDGHEEILFTGYSFISEWKTRTKQSSKAFGKQSEIVGFFSVTQNRTDFFSILNNESYSKDKKANYLEALGLERMALPGLNSLKSAATKNLRKLTQDKNTNTALVAAVQKPLSMINSSITETKDKINTLRQ